MSYASYKKAKSCPRCGATKNLTKDHIIPQAFFNRLGLPDMYEDHENLQTLCKPCNVLKGMLLDSKNPRTYPLMMKMIDRWVANYGVVRKPNTYVFRNLPVKHDTTVYRFAVSNPVEDLKDIYRKQHQTIWPMTP